MKKYVAVFSIIAVVAVVALAIAITPAFTNAITTSYKTKEDVVYESPIDIQDELTNELDQEGDLDYSVEESEQSSNNKTGVILTEQISTIKSNTIMDNAVNYEDGVLTSVTDEFRANGTSYKPGFNSTNYNITAINEGVFRNCKKLREVDLSDHINLKTISQEAFFGCDNLEIVKLPAGITDIGSQAFGNTKWLKDRIKEASQKIVFDQADRKITYEMTGLVIVDGIVIDGHSATGTMTTTFTDITKEPIVVNNILLLDKYKVAPADTNYLDITKISRNAFSYNQKITQVELGDKIADIPYRAFSSCPKLATISIPGVKTIGNYAFENSTSLFEVNNINVDFVSIGLGAFRGCTSLRNIDISEVYSSTHFFSIGNQAFMNCTNLDLVRLPRNLNTIGVSAYMGCTSLRRVYFDQNAVNVTLKQSVFKDCTRMRIVDLAKAVTNVPNYTFANCIRLDPDAPENLVDPERYSGSGIYAFNKDNVTIGAAGNSTVTAIYTGAAPADIYDVETSPNLDTLDLLTAENGDSLGLLTSFDPAQTSYVIDVPFIYSTVYVSATSESNITIKVGDNVIDNNTISLEIGTPKEVKIITKTNMNSEKEYTLTLTRTSIILKPSADSEETADNLEFEVEDNTYSLLLVKYTDPSIYLEVPGIDLNGDEEGTGKTLVFDENDKVELEFTNGCILRITRTLEPIGD